jgi:multidrug efflux pump subunit AcrA (membrane-fusion protein)
MRTLTFLACVLLLAGCSQQVEEAEPQTVVQVKVQRATGRDVQLSATAPATIYPREQASIASKITAPIRTLLVKKGDTVVAGQVLARLENRDLIAQRTEALDKARADAASAQAALAQADKNLERRQQLYDQGAIPARDLLVTQTEAAQAKASYDAARRYLDLLQGATSGAPGAAASNDGESRTAFLNTQIEFTEIRSPFNGVVTEQFLYPGDMAKPEVAIFTVMDLSTAVARAQVPAAEIAAVRRQQACFFQTGDLPGRRSSGHVSVVNQAVDPVQRTVEVWCEIPNPARSLRAGVFGSVTISTGTAPDAIVLPVAAVQFQEGSTKGRAVVVDQQGIAHLRNVEAAPLSDDDEKVRVIQGIKAGENVVIEGGYGLPDGTHVTIANGAQ